MMRAVSARRTAVLAVVVALAVVIALVVWRPFGAPDSADPPPSSTTTVDDPEGPMDAPGPGPAPGPTEGGGDAIPPSTDGGPTPSPDGGAPAEPEVVAAIEDEGSTPVVVTLDVPDGLTPELRAVAVAVAAEAVLASLPPGSYEGVKPTGTVPMLSLAVDATGLAALRAAAPVAAVGVDGLNETFSVASIGAVQADQAWERGATGTGGVVAVLDTGVAASHPYLTRDGVSDVVAEACFSSSFSTVTSLCADGASSAVGEGAAAPCTLTGCWHGTHVAGIAAGGAGASSLVSPTSASGVAPDAEIIAVQVFSRYTTSSGSSLVALDSDITRALEWLYAQHDQHPGLVAVNLSLGDRSTGYADACDGVRVSFGPMKAAIDDLRSVGIITVIASGNESRRGEIAAPACLSSAVAVGAVDNSVPPQVATFSNHGSQIELLAPGSLIRSSDSPSGMKSESGTSMATPAVAGALAVLADARPDLPAEDRLAVLKTAGRPVTGVSPTRPMIQLANAVDGALDGRPWAPRAVTGTAGNGEVSLQWDPPTDDGEGLISGYEVTATPGGATCTAVAATSCTVSGLTNGVAHRFAVRAENPIGTGPAAESGLVVPIGLPGPPEATGAFGGDGTVAVWWSPPGSNGGSAITGYQVTTTPGSAGCSTTGTTSCVVDGLTNGQAYSVSVVAQNQYGAGPTADVAAVVPAPSAMVPVVPARLMDTRPPGPDAATVDGAHLGTGAVLAPEIRSFDVLGRGGVPASGVGAVALNVTVTGPTAFSNLRVFPGPDVPNASNLNFVAGETVPNMVIAKVGADGTVSVANAVGATHVVVDVMGWFPDTSPYQALEPVRLMDTRAPAPGITTIDGQALNGGSVGSLPRTLKVTGRGGVPASGVGAVALNVTVTGPTAWSNLRVFPTGTSMPNASNLNFTAGQTVPNMVIAKVGADGTVSIANAAGATHVVVDVMGWFPADTGYAPLDPARLMDTRAPGGDNTTADGQFLGGGALGPGQVRSLTVTARGGVPTSGVSAVALNVTAVGPTAFGNLRVFPGPDVPNASNLNFTAGETVPNMVVAQVGADGKVSIANAAGSTHVVVDVMGWFP